MLAGDLLPLIGSQLTPQASARAASPPQPLRSPAKFQNTFCEMFSRARLCRGAAGWRRLIRGPAAN
jgi:hypothetical protein